MKLRNIKKENVIPMNSIKKGLLTFGATAALVGTFAVNNTLNVEAAGWEARTVEEVKEDIQSDGVESKYSIQWGDTLGTIATALDISIDQIVDVNEIGNRNLIIAGNTLHLSTDSTTVSVEDNVTHEVETFELGEAEVEEVTEPIEETVEETTEAPVEEEPAEESVEAPVEEAPAAEESSSNSAQQANNGSEGEAKEWIAQRESNGSYTAYNPAGGYYGRYQLNPSLIDHGASPAEQEAAADNYVAGRYDSWSEAKAFWEANGWY